MQSWEFPSHAGTAALLGPMQSSEFPSHAGTAALLGQMQSSEFLELLTLPVWSLEFQVFISGRACALYSAVGSMEFPVFNSGRACVLCSAVGKKVIKK